MASRRKVRPYSILRPHAARVLKVAEYPTHVNGGYMDNPDRIPMMGREPKERA